MDDQGEAGGNGGQPERGDRGVSAAIGFRWRDPVHRLRRDRGKVVFGGVVPAKTRVSMAVPAGARQLMVVGESAGFLAAALAAGKTYDVVVTPRMGRWKARFPLLPVRADGEGEHRLGSAGFKEWIAACAPVTKTAAADTWYADHQADIEAKRVEYLEKWNRKTPDEKAPRSLCAEDGV